MEDRVLHSSCMDVMQSLEGDSVPLIVADPPYGIGYHSNHYKERNPHDPVAGDWSFQIGSFLHEAPRESLQSARRKQRPGA